MKEPEEMPYGTTRTGIPSSCSIEARICLFRMGPIPDKGQGPPRKHPTERSALCQTRSQTKQQRHQHAKQPGLGPARNPTTGGQTWVDGQNCRWQGGSESGRLLDRSEHQNSGRQLAQVPLHTIDDPGPLLA